MARWPRLAEAGWLLAITALAFATRFHNLSLPAIVSYVSRHARGQKRHGLQFVRLTTRSPVCPLPAWLRWDEAHFGKFAGYYIKRQFYFDVHPPLGKLLLGAAAWASGFDGGFEFPSTERYPADVPYVQMRQFCAAVSAAMVPLVYSAARHLKLSVPAATLAASMILFGARTKASRHRLASRPDRATSALFHPTQQTRPRLRWGA